MSVLEEGGYVDLGQEQEPQADIQAWEKDLPEVEDAGWFDISQPYTPPDFTLCYGTTGFAPLGGIHTLTGQSGHGKTMTFTLLMAALLRGEYMGLRRIMPADVPVRILYIDTEMEDRNTLAVVARLLNMTGWTLGQLQGHFRAINLRNEIDIALNWGRLRRAVIDFCPSVIFVDGMLDMVNDFNDLRECQEAVRRMMVMASLRNVSVWCLVHQNPGTVKMVGHMGSAIERKVTDEFVTKKEKQGDSITFTITHQKARSKNVSDIGFHIVDAPVSGYYLGVPQIMALNTMPEVEEALAYKPRPVEEIVGDETMTTRTLREAVCKEHRCGKDAAMDLIKKAVNDGRLRADRSHDGTNTILYSKDDPLFR
ncbi:MAG: AAA family ATPase [Prevotellaceae bacterium]|nr:AAA family ATPase [Prevotellaceae bacterium]